MSDLDDAALAALNAVVDLRNQRHQLEQAGDQLAAAVRIINDALTNEAKGSENGPTPNMIVEALRALAAWQTAKEAT